MKKCELSYLQKYIWLDQKLTPESSKYNIGGYALINGAVELDLFKKAVSIFSDKNTLLKSFFKEEDGSLFLCSNDRESDTGILCMEKKTTEEAIDFINDDFKTPFNTVDGQLLCKIWLIKTSPNTFIWYTKLHHLIADGYSFQLFFNGISAIYQSLKSGTPIKVDKSNISFERHVKEEKEYYNSNTFTKNRDFWKDRYESLPDLIFQSTPKENSFYHKELQLPLNVLQQWQKLSELHNFSVFHLLLAGFFRCTF
jgi:surfactin family lipopeptide synthetase A